MQSFIISEMKHCSPTLFCSIKTEFFKHCSEHHSQFESTKCAVGDCTCAVLFQVYGTYRAHLKNIHRLSNDAIKQYLDVQKGKS